MSNTYIPSSILREALEKEKEEKIKLETLWSLSDQVKLCKNKREEDFFLNMMSVAAYYNLTIHGFTLPSVVSFENKGPNGLMNVHSENLSKLHERIPYQWWHNWIKKNNIVPNNYEDC